MEIDHNLIQRIQLSLEALKRAINTESPIHHGITRPQLFLLYFLSREERCKLSHLAEKLEVKPSAITVMIDRLEKPGFVKRVHDTEDRRSIWVMITPEGREALDHAIDERNRVLGKYLGRLTSDEASQLANLLAKMMGEDRL